VAAGVAEHSGYRSERVARLLRTLRPMLTIAFGNEQQATAAAATVRAVHGRVRGVGYSATDPALLAWVLATLIDTSLLMYRRFVGPLQPDVEGRYYHEVVEMGALLGMPRAALPSTLDGFGAYVADMTRTMQITADSRAIARDLFRTLPGTGPAMAIARELTAGLLPPTLRSQYGLAWDPARAAALEALAGMSRQVLPLVPRPLRAPPAFLMPARDGTTSAAASEDPLRA
jgi:uncharacterized protein (DUF2236 family)